MSDDEKHDVFTGREQRIDAKRTLRVKAHHRWQPTCSPEFAKNFELAFGKRKPAEPAQTPIETEPSDEAKAAYRANFDAIFGAK